ncbi:MAG: type 4a pilus biogenesis protein PilO [Candidatus Caldarchaeum sp.]
MKKKVPHPGSFMALTVAAFLAGGAMSYWQIANITQTQDSIDELRSQLEDSSILQKELEQVREKFNITQSQLQHLESTVSTEEYVPTLLKELEATGKSCQLQISGVRPLPPPPKKKTAGEKEEAEAIKPYRELDVQVKALGDFEQIMAFLKKLEEFPKIIAVKTLSINPKLMPDGKTLEALETTLNVRVFVFPKEGGFPKRPNEPQAKTAIPVTEHKQEAEQVSEGS